MERVPSLALRMATAGGRAGLRRDFSASAATTLNYGKANDKYRVSSRIRLKNIL